MNTTSILRFLTLLTLAAIALYSYMAIPAGGAWVLKFWLSKALCLASAAAFVRLYRTWSRTDALIRAYNRWCEKGGCE